MTNADRPPADADTLLLEFVRDRDAPCPLCGYNLRNLPKPTCPECCERLSLSVDLRKLRFGWFIAAIAPGIFSSICAAFLLVPLMISLFAPSGPSPWQPWSVDAFGWLSGLAALVLVKYRFAFLRQPQATQRVWAVTVWAIHVAALAAFIVAVVLFQ